MKIALVNLAKFEKFKDTPTFNDDIKFLNDNQFEYVDYCSDSSDYNSLLHGFNQALDDSEVDLIWFVCGGEKTIKFLTDINWEKVEQTNKIYLGASDFTHFAFKAIEHGQTCYYGAGLKKINIYHPTNNEKRHIIHLLKYRDNNDYQVEYLNNKKVQLKDERIIGGHLFISTFMMNQINIPLKDRFLFLEHHYVPGETLTELEYFIDQLKLVIDNNLPKGFILGHTELYDKDNNEIDVKIINQKITELLNIYNLPILYIDHFQQIIKFS